MITPVKLFPGLFFVASGTILLVIAVVIALNERDFLLHAARAEGVVVTLNAGRAHPQVEFVDSHGVTHSFPAGGAISHGVHDRVRVAYRREDPSLSPELDEPGSTWFGARGAALIGLAHLVGGVCSMTKLGKYLS